MSQVETSRPGEPQPAVTLRRHLSTFSAAMFGLSYICPTVVVSTFGVIATRTGGASALAYLIATVAMVLTAASYGRMAAQYPESGSAYTYVSRTLNPTLGLVVGWVLILDYFFIPAVICLITGKALEIVWPGSSFRVWIVVVAALATGVNLLGIKVADRVNLSIMTAQLAAVAALLLLCARSTVGFSLAPFHVSPANAVSVMGGAAIACYSFLGFDAVSTLSEETVDPTRSIPRATILAAALAGSIFVATVYMLSLVHPSLRFADVDNAGFEILQGATGKTFSVVFTCVLIVSNLASLVCAQAGASRLLYVMARDNRVPKRFFGYLSPRFRTPSLTLGLMGVVMLLGELLDIDIATSCVNFGAFSAFLMVNICVATAGFTGKGALRVGGIPLLMACAGAVASIWLLFNLSRLALTVGVIWLLVGLCYVAYQRRRAGAAGLAPVA